jgi:putative ABC transport system substrate-binding protein
MKLFKYALLSVSLGLFSANTSAETKIGIVVPMQHQAMTEIVNGFENTLKKQYDQPISFKVANAQNDQNLQHAIIQQMRDANFDLIVTIATHTGEMAASIIKNKPIICLAADISDQQRQKLSPCNVAIVDDEIATQRIIEFIHQTYPALKNMVLIHSNSEKILPEVAEAIRASKQFNMKTTPISIQNLMDLQNVARNLPKETQAIFILKDSLVVNGIAQLANIARSKQIPLITSDEGSITKGAHFAVGVRESQIGINGAELALQILKGRNACSLPINKMNNLFVFINPEAMRQSQQNVTPIVATAKKLNYQIHYVNN